MPSLRWQDRTGQDGQTDGQTDTHRWTLVLLNVAPTFVAGQNNVHSKEIKYQI